MSEKLRLRLFRGEFRYGWFFVRFAFLLLPIIWRLHSTPFYLRGPLMPHDDEIVARDPLVNFYALGALRKPDVWLDPE